MKKDYKRIPFDLEKAKRITNGEMKGKIETRDGRYIRILAFDIDNKDYPIAVERTEVVGGNSISQYTINGFLFKTSEGKGIADLVIKVPTYHNDYSNFVPHKRQICLVRDSVDEYWKICVCKCKDAYGVPRFYEYDVTYSHILPFNKVTERLLGTKQSYEQLIEELDKEL